MTAPSGELLLEVDAALGPGLDYELIDNRLVGTRARPGGVWLGLDRAAVIESDDGAGRQLAAVVAVPASTFAGCRLRARLVGAWRDGGRLVVVAHVNGTPPPLPPLARLVAELPEDAIWLDGAAASEEVARAYRRYRERRAHARILGGKAWLGTGIAVERSRFTTPHSSAEYRLDRLPPRYLRGLHGLLDDDERLLYAIERPELRDAGMVDRLVRRVDRRAALLALTDRQLLWAVDHADPDRYLQDWGVDVEVVPVERVERADLAPDAPATLVVATAASTTTYRLPDELASEASVMTRLLRRFTPPAAGARPRRVYQVPEVEPDAKALDAFGQAEDARLAVEAARAMRPIAAAFFDPRRTRVRRSSLLALDDAGIELRTGEQVERIGLDDVASLGITLSALVGRLVVTGRSSRIDLRFPAPLAGGAAAWLRSARRAVANR